MDQPNNYDAVRTAHASMGIVAWVVFFPCGSALMRLLSSPRSWLVHALTQIFAYAMYTAVVGMGIWMTMNSDNPIGSYHPVIGLVLFCLVFCQAIGGYIHHWFYKNHNRQDVVAWTHVWLGRIVITLGMINGGLGLMLSGNATRGEYIAYGVITACIWLAWVLMVTFTSIKKTRSGGDKVEKGETRASDSN